MKFLIGSQNYGYNTGDSDKDWIEFIYPTWLDIAENKCISIEKKDNKTGELTKIRDIRHIVSMIFNSNWDDLQILFSVETYGSEEFSWFIENRQRLIRCNPWRMSKSNVGCIATMMEENTAKSIVRAYALTRCVEQVAYDEEVVLLRPELAAIRQNFTPEIREAMVYEIHEKLRAARLVIEQSKNNQDKEIIAMAKTAVANLLSIHVKF